MVVDEDHNVGGNSIRTTQPDPGETRGLLHSLPFTTEGLGQHCRMGMTWPRHR